MKAKVKYEGFLNERTHLHIANGNRKLGKGIYTINLLSGDTPLTLSKGRILTNVSGTCGGCCNSCKNDCYAIRCQLFHHNNMQSWIDNTLLARFDVDRFFYELQCFLDCNLVSVIRFHSMGEVPTKLYMEKIFIIAAKNPDVKFYFYTKRFTWLEECIKDFCIPENLYPLVSIWNNNYKNPCNLTEFIYDDHTDEYLKDVFHCPSVDEKGRNTGFTCSKCKRCFTQKDGKIAIYAH